MTRLDFGVQVHFAFSTVCGKSDSSLPPFWNVLPEVPPVGEPEMLWTRASGEVVLLSK